MDIKKILKKYFELIEKENIEIKVESNHNKNLYNLSTEEMMELSNIKETIKKNIDNFSKAELLSMYGDADLVEYIEAELKKRQTLN